MSLQILKSETNKSWVVTLVRRSTAVAEDEVVKDYILEYMYSIYSRDMELQRERLRREEVQRQELQRVQEIRNCNYYTTSLDPEEFTKTSQHSYPRKRQWPMKTRRRELFAVAVDSRSQAI